MTLELDKILIVNVLVDVIQRPPNRILKIVDEKGWLLWDWVNGGLKIYNSQTKKWQEFLPGEGYKGFNVEEMYEEEMKNVINSLKKEKKAVSTFENELLTADVVLLAEKSSKLNSTIKI